jgi:hypothetical protein
MPTASANEEHARNRRFCGVDKEIFRQSPPLDRASPWSGYHFA